MNARVKPVFKHQPPVDKETFAGSTCLLTISVGQEVHEGEKFAATVELVNASFGSCILMIDDVLQRHTMALTTQRRAATFVIASVAAGEDWLRRNLKHYCHLSRLRDVVRWERWLMHPRYFKQQARIKALIASDPTYKASFESTIDEFLRRHYPRVAEKTVFDEKRARALCRDYLVEECTAMCFWPELGCHFEVYPSKRNAAMEETHKRFVLPHYPDLLHPIAIKFKNRKPLKPQDFELHPVSPIIPKPYPQPCYRHSFNNPPVSEQNAIAPLEHTDAEIEMLKTILALMPGHVYWVDRNGQYLGCNDIQAQSAGLYSRSDILGKTNQDLPWNYHCKVLPAVLDQINAEVMSTGQTMIIEEPALLKNGVHKIFLSTKAPLRNVHGDIIGMVGISVDITERKQAEAALQLATHRAEAAHQAKTEFFNQMRHDIRTPMSGIVEVVKRIRKMTNEPMIIDLSALLARSCDEFLRFLTQLVDSINASSGEIPLLKKKFNLRALLENIVKMNLPKAYAKGITLHCYWEPAMPPYVMGDPIRTYRIVLELVTNAVKFTHQGRVHILASLAQEKDGHLVVEIRVEDTGIGISEDKVQTLFTRSKKGDLIIHDGSYHRPGFGLFIVTQYLDDLQGEIRYEPTRLASGSCFICLIPVRRTLLNHALGEDEHHYVEWAKSLGQPTTG